MVKIYARYAERRHGACRACRRRRRRLHCVHANITLCTRVYCTIGGGPPTRSSQLADVCELQVLHLLSSASSPSSTSFCCCWSAESDGGFMCVYKQYCVDWQLSCCRSVGSVRYDDIRVHTHTDTHTCAVHAKCTSPEPTATLLRSGVQTTTAL